MSTSGRTCEPEAARQSVARRAALFGLGFAAAVWPVPVRAEALSLPDAPGSSLPRGARYTIAALYTVLSLSPAAANRCTCCIYSTVSCVAMHGRLLLFKNSRNGKTVV